MELRRQKFNKILLCGIFALVFAAFSAHPTHALDVIQKDLTVSSHSPTITIHNNGIVSGSSKVTPNIEFNKIGDFVTYKLTLGNNDGKKYQITNVSDNNTNDAVELTYAYPTALDTTDKSIDLTIKYVKRSTTPLQTITITINLVDEDYLNQQISLTVPNTGANTVNNTSSTNIRNVAIVYIIIATAIIIVYITIRSRYQKSQKSTKLPKIITATLLLAGLIPLAVIAANLKDLQFIVEFSNIKFNGPYTITFNTTTTDTIAPQTIDHNTLATQPSDPIKTGYTFINWLDENSQAYDFTQPVTKDADLTANFTLNSYSITYTLPAGATNATANPATYTYEDNNIALAAPTMDHYDFIGWTTPTDNTPKLSVTIPQHSIGDKTFIANFTPHKYTITYVLNGGTGVTNPTEYTINTPAFTLATPTSPSPTSKYFKGWLDKSTSTSPTTPQSSITITPGVTTGDLVFEAIFQDFYTVNFDRNNGSGIMNSQRVDSRQATNLSTNTFTRTNFTFDGWNTKANGTGADYTDGQEITDLVDAGESITLYAKWYGGNIFYNDNGANSTTKMGNQTIAPTSTDALLWASNFKHSDNTKTFIGWNTQADGNGTKYGPNQTILDDATIKKIKEENITLYAMWIKSEGTMQSWNGCAAMNIGDVKALTDNRDGNVYAIAKLASGKCWMIENLRLTNKHAITGAPVTIDSTNTNNPSPGFALGDPHDFAVEPWCTTQEATCIGQPHYVAINTTNPVDRMTDPSQNAYSYSNHYNFYAATAGTPLVEITAGSIGLKATGDICPAGWRIPIIEETGSGSGDYRDLGLALAGGNTSSAAQNYLWQAFPNNFILSGGIFSSATYRNLGSSGSYIANYAWNPAGHSGAVIYADRAVYTSVGNSRYTAIGVRCISNI